MPRNVRQVRVRFMGFTGTGGSYHQAFISRLHQEKRRCWEPFESVDYASPLTSKELGLDPDGRFFGKPLLHNGGKP